MGQQGLDPVMVVLLAGGRTGEGGAETTPGKRVISNPRGTLRCPVSQNLFLVDKEKCWSAVSFPGESMCSGVLQPPF